MSPERGNLVVHTIRYARVHHHHRSYHNRLDPFTGEPSCGHESATLHFLWMMVSGELLPNRRAILPALRATGLSNQAIPQPRVAFRLGAWNMPELLARRRNYVKRLPGWADFLFTAMPEKGSSWQQEFMWETWQKGQYCQTPG